MDLSQKHFERAAEHHATVSKHHRLLAKAAEKGLRKSAKADMENLDVESLAEFLDQFIEQHAAIADEHAEMSEHCTKCARSAGEAATAAAEKAAQDRFSKRDGQDALVPTNVSALAPPNRSVPRPGQPTVPVKPNVPEEFSKLVAVEEGEEQATG